jgi:dolichol-phosphate mannosyltransferase
VDPLTIIIPVKDEEAGLSFLLDDFRKSILFENPSVYLIFVIDERTSDASKIIAEKFSEMIIDQEGTTGKGAAIKQAIAAWTSNPTPHVVFLDADGSYSFDSVIKIVAKLEQGADIVSGSRFLGTKGRPEGMSRLHNIGNKLLSRASSLRNGRRISDLCSGLWGFREEALCSLHIQSNGFDLEAEIAGLSRKAGLRHAEVQVEWSQRKGGMSKLRSFTDGFIILIRVLRT